MPVGPNSRMRIGLVRYWWSNSSMKVTIGEKISSSSMVTASAVVRRSTCCSLAISAWVGRFLFGLTAPVIWAGLTDSAWNISCLAAATISNASFHSGGNLANWVSLGLVSQTAPVVMTIWPILGFFSGSVIMIGKRA